MVTNDDPSKSFAFISRDTALINLDPANDALPYKCDINISELITLDDVMNEFGLGPNGGLIYCMEYLEQNFEWLEGRLRDYKGLLFSFSFCYYDDHV